MRLLSPSSRGLRQLTLITVFTLCAVLLPESVHGQATYPSEFKLDWCIKDQCFDTRISAAHFQMRIDRYYAEGSRPPLKEAFFICTMPPPYLRELLFGCPGMVILAHLLLAEVRMYTHLPSEAAELVSRAQAMMAMPELEGSHLQNIHHAWPYDVALGRYEALSEQFGSQRVAVSVDFVIPHCREDLSWFVRELEFIPERTRIFIYEKCGGQGGEAANLTALLPPHVKVFSYMLEDAVDPTTGKEARRDECTAYLSHVVNEYAHGSEMGEMTLFLHGDPGDHTPFGLLNVVLRGFALGTMSTIDFLHLGSPRLVSTFNPCQSGLFELAIGRPLRRSLSTYCCSQFAVSKRRIQARPLAEYERMLSLVDGTVPDACERIGPSYERYAGQRLSHCFFLEFMWHVVFGEDEALPLRGDDQRLPPALRLKDNEERLPDMWRTYIGAYAGGRASFEQQGHERWLGQLLHSPGAGRAVQVNYGDSLMR